MLVVAVGWYYSRMRTTRRLQHEVVELRQMMILPCKCFASRRWVCGAMMVFAVIVYYYFGCDGRQRHNFVRLLVPRERQSLVLEYGSSSCC